MSIANLAPGFFDLAYRDSQLITDVGWNVIYEAVMLSAQLYDEALTEQLAAFASAIDPTKPQFKFRLPVTVEMQPLEGEDDSPVPVRGYDEYDIAFPLLDVGLAWGNNRKSRAKATVRDASEFTLHTLQADSRWQRRQMQTALFYPDNYPFDDDEFGLLTIKPLANGDADQYHFKDGSTATDNHYGAQAEAIDGTHYPFDAIADDLTEHPDNGGDIAVYVPKGLVASIRALSDFVPYIENRRLQVGGNTDIITDFPAIPFGDRRLGYLEDADVYVARWDVMPAGYLLAMPTETSRSLLGYREEPEASLQGLRPETHEVDGNHIVQRLLRTRGFAVQNRTAAVVWRVGNATYAAPAGFDRQPNP